MANLPSLPTTAEVLGGDAVGSYGPYLSTEVDRASGTFLLKDHTTVLAVVSQSTAAVSVNVLTTSTVPYVNRAIAHTGKVIIKDWRTKAYRLKGTGIDPVRVLPPVEPPQAPAEPQPEPVEAPAEESAALAVAPMPEPLIHVAPVSSIEVDIEAVPGLEVPAAVKVKGPKDGYVGLGDIVVPESDYQTLLDAWKLRQAGVPSAVLVTGPAGTAKTALVRAFAATLQVPFLKVDGGAIRTADDWGGAFRQDPETKTWSHRWSPFARALRAGQPCVILIDELTRTESPQALNGLLGLLDWTSSLLVPDANAVLTLPKGILIVATANMGAEFVGTLPLDGAVRQRFPYGIRLDYPKESVETGIVASMTGIDRDTAGRLVRMAAQQRLNRDDASLYPSGSVISTRVVLDIARRIQECGTDPRAAITSTLRGQFDTGDEKALSICVDAQFPEAVSEVEEHINEVEAITTTWGTVPPVVD